MVGFQVIQDHYPIYKASKGSDKAKSDTKAEKSWTMSKANDGDEGVTSGGMDTTDPNTG